MPRTVTHAYTVEALQQLQVQCGNTDGPIRDAFGYLSMWGIQTYPHVDIVILGQEGDMEIIACYRKEAGFKADYTIGAVWHDDHFGFHS